ncbi:MAG: FtsX-like permease family protein [Luteitalea sp.]|nr:FtsX-like permease family protein [Luteitalea sp.]
MKALAFAARSLFRQPGRAGLGILGIAAVGALLFDMLLLSRGLVVSFRDLLDEVGFDVRVLASDAVVIGGPRVTRAAQVAREVAALPEVAEAIPLRMAEAEADGPGQRSITLSVTGVDLGRRRPWALVAGDDLESEQGGELPALLVTASLATALGTRPGSTVMLRFLCGPDRTALPMTTFRVAGLADFPFDSAEQLSAAATRSSVARACGDQSDDWADMLLVASSEGHGADAAVAAIRRQRPELYPATNEQIVARMRDTGFTYFRQISAVLSTITMVFGFLLITVLLTVSVNQRLGEIAALRALGFSRARVAADVLSQSVLLVGSGGALALPLGVALSVWLDAILKAMPGIPASMHFFVFEGRALALHGALLAVTALLAALYPMWLVATLPIATTLRNEVVS